MDCFINYPHNQMFIIKRHVIKDFIDKTIAHKLPHALEAVIFAKSKQNIFLHNSVYCKKRVCTILSVGKPLKTRSGK